MTDKPPEGKRELLQAIFRKVGQCFGELHTANVRIQHLEECHGVMLDHQRDLLRELEALRAQREAERLAFIAVNRRQAELIVRLITGKDALLRALGVQEYQRLQRLSKTPLTSGLELNELEALDLAKAYQAISGAH